jgi:hypothetical protein
MHFVPNQLMNAIAPGKSFYEIVLVLPDSLDEI